MPTHGCGGERRLLGEQALTDILQTELTREVTEAWAVTAIRRDKTFSEGLTSAEVLLVDIQCDREDGSRFDGGAILKIQKIDREGAEHEIKTLKTVTSLPNKFSQARIPKLVNWHFDGASLFMLQEVAAQGIQFAKALKRAKADDRIRAVDHITTELLNEWALRDFEWPTERKRISICELTKRLIGEERLGPHCRLAEWMIERDIPVSAPNFIFNRRLLPNPLHLFQRPELQQPFIRPFRSLVHGDFHGNNVLLERGLSDTLSQAEGLDIRFFVIDVGTFKQAGLAFYDLCYLEHALLRDYVAQRSLLETINLGEQINGIQSNRDILQGDENRAVLMHSASIIRGIEGWIAEHFPERKAAAMQQFYLARVAAALNYSNKRVSDAQRERSFLLSAIFAEKLIQFLEVQYSDEGVPWSSGKKPTSLDGAKLWSALDCLDANKSMFIHFAGPNWRAVDNSAIGALVAQPISMYLDFEVAVDGSALVDRLRPQSNSFDPR